MPGQTKEDVCRAEGRFVAKVAELHSEAEGKPCLIGNCQAGWQITLMSAIHPDVVGPLLLAGAPLSYWAGVHGTAPMRYLGGLLGGTWLTALSGDLDNGRFDGAYLVGNFESLKPRTPTGPSSITCILRWTRRLRVSSSSRNGGVT
jgi:Protein of unknown function (DUF3141)